jgi:hypothetical protein
MKSATENRLDHQLFVCGRAKRWGALVYYAVDCGRTSNQNPFGNLSWEGWSLDTRREPFQCTIPTADSVGRADDGSTLIGGEVMVDDQKTALISAAENRVHVRLSNDIEYGRLPLFIGTDRNAVPTIYDATVKLHLANLGQLPDVLAAVEFRNFIGSLFRGNSGRQGEPNISSLATEHNWHFYENARFPVEVEGAQANVLGVMELVRALSDDTWTARIYLIARPEGFGRGSSLFRAVSLSIRREFREFRAELCTIDAIHEAASPARK